jgi:murein DD-endopeptidase MepM/ murein hydrolase activator NlpD
MDLPPAYLPPVTLTPPPDHPGATGRRRRLDAPPAEPLTDYRATEPEPRRSPAPAPGEPRDGGARAAGGSAASASGGRRKAPAGHRKRARRKAFPAVPVAASMVTLVAAASGAMSLHPGQKADVKSASEEHAMPAGIALSLTQLGNERDKAAARSDRSDRNSYAGTVDRSNFDRERTAEEARDRQAWEQQRAKELAGIRGSGDGETGVVLDRAIHWVLPVSDYRLSAGFGDGGSLWSNNHTGQDFAAPLGTSVRSVGAGEIISAGYEPSYGNKIEVRHLDGTVTWYCHLSGYAQRSGYVAPGEVIGYVGSTGNSTGPHLHFEVRPDGGDPIDPLPWLRSFGLEP